MTDNFLEELNITTSAIKCPYFGILYSLPGAGKTWLCSYAPKPFYIAVEKGVEQLSDVGRFTDKDGKLFKPHDSTQFYKMMGHFVQNDHEYKTIIIDSAKFVEHLFIDNIIARNPTEKKKDETVQVESIGDYNFGTGYAKLLTYWERFIKGVDALNSRGINVILIAHARDKNASTIGGEEFKRTGLDLSEFGQYSVPNLLYARCDWMFFMRSESQTVERKKQFGGTKTVASEGKPDIVLYTRAKSGFDAKIRTADIENIDDFYTIDINDQDTSKKIFTDLEK